MKKKNKMLITILMISLILSFGINKSISQVTDIDGNTYKTVKIGTQEWMTENLNVEHYRNGDPIPEVKDLKEWERLTTGAWCYYDNDSKNGKTYGKLYNGYAVNDPLGLEPNGWHIPREAEWTKLSEYFGGKEVAGGKLKATTLWWSPNAGATNESGFTAFPGGATGLDPMFGKVGKYGWFWSCSVNLDKDYDAYCRYLDYDDPNFFHTYINKFAGMSCRCIKD